MGEGEELHLEVGKLKISILFTATSFFLISKPFKVFLLRD